MSTCRSQCDGDPTHIQCGERTGAATSAAFLLATTFLACPTRTNGRTAKPGEGPTPTQILGVRKCRKTPFEIMGASKAHRNLVREVGPECRCAVRNATATRVGVRAARRAYNLHGQPAADRDAPRGRAARDGKSGGAWGFAARARDGGRVHYAGGRGACVEHPSAGASSSLDARCICVAVAVPQGPRRLTAEAASAHLVGVGCRQLLRVPKRGRLDRLGGGGGEKNATYRRLWGH
jgi:hypothetical protein